MTRSFWVKFGVLSIFRPSSPLSLGQCDDTSLCGFTVGESTDTTIRVLQSIFMTEVIPEGGMSTLSFCRVIQKKHIDIELPGFLTSQAVSVTEMKIKFR